MALAIEPRVRQNLSWLRVPATWWLTVMGRLKPNVTAEQVQANLNAALDRATRNDWNAFVARMPARSLDGLLELLTWPAEEVTRRMADEVSLV